MTAQFKAATIRALYGALLTAAMTLLTALQVIGLDDAALAASVTFVGYMLARGMAEGLIDSSRDANGSVTPADVGAYRPPISR